MSSCGWLVYVLEEVSPEEVGDLLHDLVVVVCVGQQVEADGGLLAVHELDMVAVLPEALGVGQLPVAGEVQARHDDEAVGEGKPPEAPPVRPERVDAGCCRRMLPQILIPVSAARTATWWAMLPPEESPERNTRGWAPSPLRRNDCGMAHLSAAQPSS